MKLLLFLSLFAPILVAADFQNWTSADGRTAELDLISVSEIDGEMTGEFKLRDGRTTTIPASKLSEEDAARLLAWEKPELDFSNTGPANDGGDSVYDKILGGNLVSVQGRSVRRLKDQPRPTDYYVFYYTASWCGPCHEFTPSLVEFYKTEKTDKFEVVTISRDSNEDSMESYAKEKEMPWPILKMRKVDDFREKFRNKGRGIPYLMVASLDGTILAEGNAFSILPQLKELVSN